MQRQRDAMVAVIVGICLYEGNTPAHRQFVTSRQEGPRIAADPDVSIR